MVADEQYFAARISRRRVRAAWRQRDLGENRITDCLKCLRNCRQPASVVLVDCPRFFPLPFRVDRHKFTQLDLFAPPGE